MTGTAPNSDLEREIVEQATVLEQRLRPGWESAERAAALLRRSDVDHLVIAARGSSDNAARFGQYLLGEGAGIEVAMAAPWLYSSDRPPRLARAAAMAISQSGCSPDIVGVLDAARDQGRPTIALTNDPGSPAAAAAEVVVPLLAGEEKSLAATKTYLASLHALVQIATCLQAGGQPGWLERVPALVRAETDRQLRSRQRFDRLAEATLITAVGRGLQYATACETALKLRELGAIAAEAYSLPDLLHGPIAALRRSGAVWVLSTHGRGQPDADALMKLREAVGTTVVVSDDEALVSAADIGVGMDPQLPSWLAPFVAVVAGQAAALRLAELRGADVDRPDGLRKVTLTR